MHCPEQLRSRAALEITILLTPFVHQKTEGVTVQYSHKHFITNGKLCQQLLLYPAKLRQMERSAMQALILHMCINYNTVDFWYSFHLLNMYELNEKKRQKGRKGKPGQAMNGTGPPFLDHTLEMIQDQPIAGNGTSEKKHIPCQLQLLL